MTEEYASLLQLPHPVSQRHPRMSNADRAAQFSPFAALTGFDAELAETARLTCSRIDPDEAVLAELDRTWQLLKARLPEQPAVRVTWFAPDPKKAGGAYRQTRGCVKKLDEFQKLILFTDGRIIPAEAVLELTFSE